ncbi:hypothetical protein [Neisseria sp.]|uniref:hypothetical protein n=1 Tax=Neisseria sp. TaxID=192066 RepID=UPI00359F5FE2
MLRKTAVLPGRDIPAAFPNTLLKQYGRFVSGVILSENGAARVELFGALRAETGMVRKGRLKNGFSDGLMLLFCG